MILDSDVGLPLLAILENMRIYWNGDAKAFWVFHGLHSSKSCQVYTWEVFCRSYLDERAQPLPLMFLLCRTFRLMTCPPEHLGYCQTSCRKVSLDDRY